LLIVQPFLIRYRKLALHRLLGKFTYILAPLIILSFVGMMIKQIGEAKAQNLNIALHMRYIVVTALVFINASLNRSLGIWFHVDFFYSALISISFVDLILLTLIYFDKVNGRGFKPFVISLILFLVVQPGIILLYLEIMVKESR
jgi:hypothetical protein